MVIKDAEITIRKINRFLESDHRGQVFRPGLDRVCEVKRLVYEYLVPSCVSLNHSQLATVGTRVWVAKYPRQEIEHNCTQYDKLINRTSMFHTTIIFPPTSIHH